MARRRRPTPSPGLPSRSRAAWRLEAPRIPEAALLRLKISDTDGAASLPLTRGAFAAISALLSQLSCAIQMRFNSCLL